MEDPYIHIPIPTPGSIRIIHLTPSTEFASPLRCHFGVLSLDESAKYTALSYSWDSQTSTGKIESNIGSLLITPNCESALRRLRDVEKTQTLWIDSICINQSPDALDERNQQVALMSEVYRRAGRVVVWVGESDEPTARALQKIREIIDVAPEANHENRREYQRRVRENVQSRANQVKQVSDDPIGPLFERSWFHRMWTVQEATLSQSDKIVLHCGKIVLPWQSVILGVDALVAANYRWGQWPQAMKLVRQLTIYLVCKRYTGVNAILDDNPGDINNDVLVFSILINAREKESKDPKDKIFALYGVLEELEIPFPRPDYRKSVEQVHRESVIATIKYDKNLYCLYHAPSEHRRDGLASWVPDWSDSGWTESDLRYGVLRSRFATCGSANAKWRFSEDEKQLIVTGKIVDSIIWRAYMEGTLRLDGVGGQNFFQFCCSTYSIFKAWVEVSQWSDYPTGESSKEALQRTLVSDSPEFNAEAARGGAFDHWYNVLTANELQTMEMALSKQLSQPLPNEPAQREAFFRSYMAQIPEAEVTFMAMQSGPDTGFHFLAIGYSQKKCFFCTEEGYFGTVADPLPTPAEAGDVIAVVAGLEMPLVLRPVEGGYQLITHAYLHGIMHGEAWPEKEEQLEEIALV